MAGVEVPLSLEEQLELLNAVNTPLWVGCVAAMWVSGVFSSELVRYVRQSKTDQPFNRILLALTALVSVVFVVTMLASTYLQTTIKASDPFALDGRVFPAAAAQLAVAPLPILLVQIWFCVRLTAVTKKRSAVGAGVFMSVASAVVSYVAYIYVVLPRIGKPSSSEAELVTLLTPLMMICIAFTDLYLAVCFHVALRQESRGFSRGTDYVVNALIRTTFQSTAVTALLAAITAMMASASSQVPAYVAPQQALVLVHPLAMVWTLNSRTAIRETQAQYQRGQADLPRLPPTLDTLRTPVATTLESPTQAPQRTGWARLLPKPLKNADWDTRSSGVGSGQGVTVEVSTEVVEDYEDALAIPLRLSQRGTPRHTPKHTPTQSREYFFPTPERP